MIRGLITGENVTPRWRGAHTPTGRFWAVPGQVCMEGTGDSPQGSGLSGASGWRVAGRSSEEEEDVEGPGESMMGDGVCLCLGGVTQQCAGGVSRSLSSKGHQWLRVLRPQEPVLLMAGTG